MAGLKNPVAGELNPCSGEIVKIDPPFFFLAVGMTFIHKSISALCFAKISLPILALVFVSDFLIHLKERREKGVRGAGVIDVGGGFRQLKHGSVSLQI